jgi:hypothetical protein
MKERAPAFQFYPKDFDTDENVRGMDDRQAGFYVRCLNHAWLNNGLPVDPVEILRLFNRPKSYLSTVWARVSQCFKLSEDGSRLINPRMEEERQKQAEWREKSSEGGKRSAIKRWGLSRRGGVRVVTDCLPPNRNSSSASPIETPIVPFSLEPPNGKPKRKAAAPAMTVEQRGWFQQYLALHPKNTIQLKSATALWAVKVTDAEVFGFLMSCLNRETKGNTTYLQGPGKWLEEHLELYANGAAPAQPAPIIRKEM